MLDFSIVWSSMPFLLIGAVWTVIYSLASVAIGFLIAVPVCSASLSGSPALRAAAAFYVSFFRGVPLIVQLLIAYYVLPSLGLNISSATAALGALSVCTAAYQAEILRGGFMGVAPGQLEAARMLGLSRVQIVTRIEVPQAVRLTAPLLINEVTMMVKASSLISVVGILELTRTAQNIATSTFQPLEIYLAAGVLYLVINGAVAYLGTVGHRQLAA